MIAYKQHMDFDIHVLVSKTICVEEEAHNFIKELALSILRNMVVVCENLSGDLIEESHVRFAIFQMSVDPVVIDNRDAVCIQNSKLKCVTRTLVRNLEKCAEDDPYAQVNKKFHEDCDKWIFENSNFKYTRNAIRAIACFVVQVCGIMINATVDQMKGTVITMEQIETYAMYQVMEDGPYVNSSLIRFVHFAREDHWENAFSKCLKQSKPRASGKNGSQSRKMSHK